MTPPSTERCPSCLFGNVGLGVCAMCGSRAAARLKDDADIVVLSTRKFPQEKNAPLAADYSADDDITWMGSRPAMPLQQSQKRSISMGRDVIEIDDEEDMIVWGEKKPAAVRHESGVLADVDNSTKAEEDSIIVWEGKKPATISIMPSDKRRKVFAARGDDMVAWIDDLPAASFGAAGATPSTLLPRVYMPTNISLLPDAFYDAQTLTNEVLMPHKVQMNIRNAVDANQAPTVTKLVEQHDDGNNKRVAMRAGTIGHTKLTDISKELMAPQRTAFLTHVLPITKSAAQRWRVGYEKQHKNSSLWDMVVKCAKALKCKEGRQWHENSDLEKMLPGTDGKVFCKNLQAYLDRPRFEALLDNIETVNDNDSNGMDCPICCDRFQVSDIAFCNATHYLCRRCLCRYTSETIQVGGIADVPCADPSCKAKYPMATIEANLSEWDKLRMQEREDARNTKVALAAKAVLSCQCGAVGIIEENDTGDSRIECPGRKCTLVFCIECGNEWHQGKSCPASKETVKWINKRTKPCPNCHTPIEKNGGCNHMHCAPPGGCNHHFQWSKA